MTEVIEYPDAEAVVMRYLDQKLAAIGLPTMVITYRVSGGAPPTRWVRVVRTGGTRRDMVTDAAQITLDCYASTEANAYALASKVRALLAAMPDAGNPDGATVYRCRELGGPSNLPDPLTRQNRYTLTVLLDIRGQALTNI